jgi:methyl-accepting chemotaxis protein
LNKVYSVYEGTRTETSDITIDHHNCAFGKFYYSKGLDAHGDMPEFKALEPIHKRVHAVAAAVVNEIKVGNKGAARDNIYELFEIAEDLMQKLNVIIDHKNIK